MSNICFYCNKNYQDGGWDGLCNRDCYHKLSELTDCFENGRVSEPDPRIVKYFSVHSDTGHSFNKKKILEYISTLKFNTCAFCSQKFNYRGWEGLCDRSCYYKLNELIDVFEEGYVSEPDPRIVKYFSSYSFFTHGFNFPDDITKIKLKSYLNSNQ